jgi:hypothetical protein
LRFHLSTASEKDVNGEESFADIKEDKVDPSRSAFEEAFEFDERLR